MLAPPPARMADQHAFLNKLDSDLAQASYTLDKAMEAAELRAHANPGRPRPEASNVSMARASPLAGSVDVHGRGARARGSNAPPSPPRPLTPRTLPTRSARAGRELVPLTGHGSGAWGCRKRPVRQRPLTEYEHKLLYGKPHEDLEQFVQQVKLTDLTGMLPRPTMQTSLVAARLGAASQDDHGATLQGGEPELSAYFHVQVGVVTPPWQRPWGLLPKSPTWIETPKSPRAKSPW